jgi:hypothetical protein
MEGMKRAVRKRVKVRGKEAILEALMATGKRAKTRPGKEDRTDNR